MAITLVTAPEDFQPVYNSIEITLDSDNKTECDFHYVADVYVNGSLAVRLKEFPDSSNGYGTFRLDEVIKDFISFNFYPECTGFKENPEGIAEYYVEVRERYNTTTTCTGQSTLSAVLYTSDIFYAWNGAFTKQQMDVYDPLVYVNTGSSSRRTRFLTRTPDEVQVGIDDFFNLSCLQYWGVHAAKIVTYDGLGNLLNTYYLDNQFGVPASPSTAQELYLTFGCGPKNLNNSFISGNPTQPIIHDNVGSYTVCLINSGTQEISEVKTFLVDRRCSPYDNYRLHWLCRFGGFDSYSFNLKSDKRTNVSRINMASPVRTGHSSGLKTISVDASDNYVFRCDWMSEDEGLWLKDLFLAGEITSKRVTGTSSALVNITGAVHNTNGLRADFVLDFFLPVGATFNYAVNDGSPIGMASSGTGTITGYDEITGYHHTNVSSTINAGALIEGTLTASYDEIETINLIGVSSYVEKKQPSTKNINFEFEARDADTINTQNY